MSDAIDGDDPARPRITPDPYPSGVYSVLSYPSTAEAAVDSLPATQEPRPGTGNILARIGNIDVTTTTLRTPVGELPLSSARVEVADEWVVRTPTWAVLCAIIGFFVVPVVSLLFLLVRETAVLGPVRVRVTGGGVRHETLVADSAEIELARLLAAS